MKDINIEKFDSKDFILEKDSDQIPFTQVCNNVIQALKNPIELALWVYLQSLPPSWQINKWVIMKHFDIGEKVYKTHMSNLKKKGLIEYHPIRDEDGRSFCGWRTIVKNGSKFNEYVRINTRAEFDPVQINTRAVLDPVLITPECKKDLHINMTDIRNMDQEKKETTNNMDMVDLKHNEKTVSSFTHPILKEARKIDLVGLKDHGFDESHITQLLNTKIDPDIIQDSIMRYAAHLQIEANAIKIKSKTSYFMQIMKTTGRYDDGKISTVFDSIAKEKIDDIYKEIESNLTEIDIEGIYRRELHRFYGKTTEQNKRDCLDSYCLRIATLRYERNNSIQASARAKNDDSSAYRETYY